MPRSYKMYFDPKNKRWRKRYRGSQFYFPLQEGETKDSSYSRCWAAFLDRKKEIDVTPPAITLGGLAALEARQWVYDKAIRDHEEVLASADVFQVDKSALEARLEELQSLRGGFDMGNPPPLLNYVQMNPFYIGSHYAALDRQGQGKTLEKLLQEFLKIKQQEVATKKISAGRWDNLQRHLNDFLSFAGPTSNPATLDATTLQSYYSRILTELAEKNYGSDYAHDRLAAVKQFIRWLWSMGILENLPRNLASLQIAVALKEVKLFPVDEIKTLLTTATGMLKLCILLMLNCGFQQKDITDLKPDEVDWELGRIKRKRSKTSKEKGTPTIEYHLWQETFNLLKEYGKHEGERVLLRKTGDPLTRGDFNADGKYIKSDSIKDAYSSLCRAEGINKPLKLLRKTGPCLLQKNPQFSSLYRLMLNRAPHGIDERHYLSYDQKLFDQAIEWLGKEYGVIKSSLPEPTPSSQSQQT